MRKTKPIPGSARRDEAGGARGESQSCETKPICRRWYDGKCLAGKDLWWIRHACETKPISLRGRVGRGWNRAKQSQFGPTGRNRWGKSHPTSAPNKPNLAGLAGEPGSSGRRMRNKPNWADRAGPRRAKRAKRTQFPAGPGGTGMRLCKTNPIPARGPISESTSPWTRGRVVPCRAAGLLGGGCRFR